MSATSKDETIAAPAGDRINRNTSANEDGEFDYNISAYIILKENILMET